MAINDLVVMDRHMHDAMDKGSTESVFYLRLICGYFHELDLLLSRARRDQRVEEFVGALREEAREDFAYLSSFKGALGPIRRSAFHFPKVGDAGLAEALEAVKDEPARVVHEDRGRRMEFADHVAAYLSFGPISDAEAARLMRRISEAIDRLARFGRAAMTAYGERVGVVESGPDPASG
jgi:hypothetical protein